MSITAEASSAGAARTTALRVEGMHCQACVGRLGDALRGVAGVASVRVTLDPPEVWIESTRDVGLDALASAANRAGGYHLVPVPDVSTAGAPAAPAAGKDRGGATLAPAPASVDTSQAPRESLYPLALIVAFILGVTIVGTASRGAWSWHAWMNDFMAGFFLVFSFFKLLDLRGFASAYRMYDLVAARWGGWAMIYPFVELGLGVLYLGRWATTIASVATLVLMLVGAAGVLAALRQKRRIRCACLGTALNLPMTTVTLVEDLVMAAMAAGMLVAVAL